MSPPREFPFLILAAILATGVVHSQERQPDRPVFRTGVHVVEIDARVFDGDGRFVTDLTADEFELLEDGVPQDIQLLYLVGGSPPDARMAAPPAEAARGPATPAPATAPRHTWVFVFDLNHLTPGGGFDRAREAVETFIRDRFREGDLGGVVAGSRMVNNRLTSVREELAAAARGVKPLAERRSRLIELTREWPPLLDEGEAIQIANEDPEAIKRAVTRACSDDPSRCYARMGYIPPDDEIRSKARRLHGDIQRSTMETLTAINALASGLAKMPGAKTIAFLSDGFVTQQLDTTLRSVVGQAGRAGARIYAIDVRGLNRGRGAGIIDQRTAEDPGGPAVQFDLQEDGPNSLAVDTGGMMIRNENNIGRALDTIAQDTARYYVLGYQPQRAAFDGTFRAIEVRVKRPGLRVRARRGYLALEPSRLLTAQPVTTTARAADRAPAKEAEPEAAAAVAPPAVTDTGTVASEPGAATDRGVRLRPDAGKRIEELSAGEMASADALARRGWEAYQRGDVEAAIGPLGEASAKPDVRPWVLYTLGLSQAALGRAREAAASWERVRQAAPEFSAVYIDLADTYVQLSDATRALDVLRDAERRWPRDPDVHNAIGVIHVRRGALDEAIEAFSRAAAAAPSEPLAYFNLGRAYELRFARGQRFVSSQRRWTSSDEDRRRAAEAYEKYLEIGGPYTTQAAEAISRLEWAKKP